MTDPAPAPAPAPALAAHVLVVSAEIAAGERDDHAGPRALEHLSSLGLDATRAVVTPDVLDAALAGAVRAHDVVITCGGTSVRPGERVPEATRALELIEIPGVAEEIRRRGTAGSPASLTSRGLCGVVENDGRRCLVLNAPSSSGGVDDAFGVLREVWPYLQRDLTGARRGRKKA